MLKIRVAILEEDQIFLKRISNAFSNRFPEELEIYSFTDIELALNAINERNAKVDLLLAGEGFDINVQKLPSNCGFAYFVDSLEIGTLRGQKTICKFQKAELMYKEMLAIYADITEVVPRVVNNSGDREAVILSFVSASGGTGSSTTAAACAKRLARANKKVLYLNLEQFGSSRDFFEAGGTFDLSDVIYAIKSHKSNLTVKLESTVKHDVSGVFFFDSCKMAFDVMEINPDDMNRLLEELKALGKYDYVVVDMDFGFQKREVEVMKQAFRIVFVSDGTEISNTKLKKGIDALSIFEQQKELKLMPKVTLLYNKFASKTGQMLENADIKVLGGIPRLDGAETAMVVNHIAEMGVFDSFLM